MNLACVIQSRTATKLGDTRVGTAINRFGVDIDSFLSIVSPDWGTEYNTMPTFRIQLYAVHGLSFNDRLSLSTCDKPPTREWLGRHEDDTGALLCRRFRL